MARKPRRPSDHDDEVEDDAAEATRVQSEHERLMHDGNEETPRFNEEGAPVDRFGNVRPLDPGEFPPDDVERSIWIVGKGGTTLRGKTYVEGDHVLLSDIEAEQVLDRGDQITNADPVADKKHAETRAKRHEARREHQAKLHEHAAKEVQDF